MRAVNCLTLAIVLSLSGCASGPPAVRLIECTTDPKVPGRVYCDGEPALWGEFVCHPLSQHEEYRRRCE